MAERNPSALSLLIVAPEPPAFFLLDGQFLSSNHRQFSCVVGSGSGSRQAVCAHLDNILGNPAAFSSLIGTPYPDPGRVVVPGAVSFADGKSFASFNSYWIGELGLIVLCHPAFSFGVYVRYVHKTLPAHILLRIGFIQMKILCDKDPLWSKYTFLSRKGVCCQLR